MTWARTAPGPGCTGSPTNLVGAQRRREQRYYRALARSAARQAVPPADAGDQVADRVSAAAAGPALAAALATLAPGTGMCCCWSRWPS